MGEKEVIISELFQIKKGEDPKGRDFKMTKDYKYGRGKEQKIAQMLRGKGASVKVSPGSKGAADLKAFWSSGKKWWIQVKSSRGEKPPSPTPEELGRLKQSATKSRATPVVAEVTPKGTKFKSARSGRTLMP